MYNYVLLKMSTCYSKHVEESNNIWRINNIQCITLVVLYGQSMSCTISPYPELSFHVLHYQSMFWTIIPCPALSVHVLNSQRMSGTINPGPELSVHDLYYQFMTWTISSWPVLSVVVSFFFLIATIVKSVASIFCFGAGNQWQSFGEWIFRVKLGSV